MNQVQIEPQTMSPKMVSMFEDHKQGFVELLTQTYLEDPVVKWYFPSEKLRKERLEKYMEVIFNFSNRFCSSYVFLDESQQPAKVVGTIVLMKPHLYITLLEQILSGVPGLIYKIGIPAFYKFIRHTHTVEEARKKVLSEPHWRGCFVAVHPNYKKYGIAHQVAQFIQKESDSTHKPFYLETAKPEIIKIYKQFGFKLLSEVKLPLNGPTMYLLLRRPK